MGRHVGQALALVALVAHGSSAIAADLSLSGFGTLGYARSDQPYTYQRFIDDSGTLYRDSVAGVQADVQIGAGFAATLQVKAAPATASDSRYEASVPWAFVSYRPSNDWLLRVGKQRIPLYLYSETVDVGVTYDFARLPTEMYSLAPSNEFVGVSAGRTWTLQRGEVSLDGYWGESKNDFRIWLRDDLPPVQRSGTQFSRLDFRGGGLVLAYRADDFVLRIGVLRVVIRRHDGASLPSDYRFVELAPDIGYYQVDQSLPGPGMPSSASVTNTTLTIGAEVALPLGFSVISEFARSVVPGSDLAPHGNRGYASILKRAGRWTPYVSYAFLRSSPATLDLYRRVNFNRLPDVVPGAAQINSAQRAGADVIIAFDQRSWAFGTSYTFSATSKLKAEWLRTHIGETSKLVDAPFGGDIRDQHIDVISLSYNVVF